MSGDEILEPADITSLLAFRGSVNIHQKQVHNDILSKDKLPGELLPCRECPPFHIATPGQRHSIDTKAEASGWLPQNQEQSLAIEHSEYYQTMEAKVAPPSEAV